MMIEKLHYSSRTTEVDGSATQIVNAYQQSTLNTDENMVKIFALIIDALALLSSAINRLKAKSEQVYYDDIRDEKITAFYFLLVSFSHHPDAVIKAAALRLLEIFEQYGMEMKNEGFTTESSLLNSMLADYKKPQLLDTIAQVPQCAEYIAALQEAQDNFETNRLSFEEAQGQEGTLGNATQLKKTVLDHVNGLLVPFLNVMEQLNEPVYGNYARTLAEITAANNQSVKRRRKKDNTPGDGK